MDSFYSVANEGFASHRQAATQQAPRRLRERLQPALLDRLTDKSPADRTESMSMAVMSHDSLRQAVLRDLRWLLNTSSKEGDLPFESFPQARVSTLNYGVRAMAGKRMSEIEWTDLEMSLHQAIVLFEPRILADTLEVRCVNDFDGLDHHNVLSFNIRGMLWCIPHPLEFLFRTEIDLESGATEIVEGESR